ncbi:hypothetical protein KA977_01780 [Candidatus Dependentiae bacterium]|nr:hypothetical protein [Candidatus Dependentiae bacterium]
MKNKIISSLKIIFYSSLILFCIITSIIYFQNKKIIETYNSVVLCVKSDLLVDTIKDEINLNSDKDVYVNMLKKYRFSHILFDKINLEELILKGLVTVMSGADIINQNRVSGILYDNNAILKNIMKYDGAITPVYQYLILDDNFLANKIYHSLKENSIQVKKIYSADSDSKPQSINILEVHNPLENFSKIKLYYQDNIIKKFQDMNFKIAILDPTIEDIKKYKSNINVFVLDEFPSENIPDILNNIDNTDYIIFKNNLIYKYPHLINKVKYFSLTHTMLQRIKILNKNFYSNIYKFIIYAPIEIKKQQLENEFKILTGFFEDKNIKISDKIARFELKQHFNYSYILCLIIIISFYCIFILKSETLLFLGNIGIAAAYSIYISRINFATNHYIVWQTGIFQIIAVQVLFFILWEKQIQNIIKGFILLFIFYYLSVLSAGLYMFSLLDIPVFAKTIIVVFQLLSFLFGLYIYRKRFDNKFLFNSIQIILMILTVMILFRNDMGLSNIFENFYNKIIRTIIIILN